MCLSFYLIILTVHTNTAQQTRLPAGWPTDKVVTMKTVTTDCGGPGVHSRRVRRWETTRPGVLTTQPRGWAEQVFPWQNTLLTHVNKRKEISCSISTIFSLNIWWSLLIYSFKVLFLGQTIESIRYLLSSVLSLD